MFFRINSTGGSPFRWASAFLLAVLLVGASGCTLRATRGGRQARVRLTEALFRHLADPALDGSGAALLVVSLDHGDTLFAHEHHRLYTPASNRKLFTAASALYHLGPNYRFTTRLLHTGAIRGDSLHGDLVLVGRGDPDLTTVDLAVLADDLVAAGLRVVTGDVRADNAWFDDVAWGAGWMWDDGPFWYWPYIDALTVNDNTVTVIVQPGEAAGDAVSTRMEPPTAYVRLESSAATGEAGDESTLRVDRHWTPKANVIDVLGILPADADSVVAVRSVEEPALYAATVFVELLEARGVTVSGAPRIDPLDADEPAVQIAQHTSDSLAVSVRNFLKVSDNLTGEQLVKVVGAHVDGPPGSFETGLNAERVFLADQIGLDTLRMRQADGSGVSRYNLFTAGQLVGVVRYMLEQDDLAPAFLNALPIAGVDGTLEERMVGTEAAGRVRAKTGSLEGVSTLTGVVSTTDGERLAFSLLMEFFVGSTAVRRAVQDSIVVALVRFRR